MKKPWMQMTSWVLNCVLILLVFWQGARLENLERQTDDGPVSYTHLTLPTIA